MWRKAYIGKGQNGLDGLNGHNEMILGRTQKMEKSVNLVTFQVRYVDKMLDSISNVIMQNNRTQPE